MKRKIDIQNQKDQLNPWVRRSMELFATTNYLDQIQKVYTFGVATPERLNTALRRRIIAAHNSRDTETLLSLLQDQIKFPYEDPVWYMIKEISGCRERNPEQVKRIADSLYQMTAEETVTRLESAPKINTQIGPMFYAWLKRKFSPLPRELFVEREDDIYILDCTEEEGKVFVQTFLKQQIAKRPDLIAKAGKQYIIGEAKWIGQSGGNQAKQVIEVAQFCEAQRGNVRRIGIVDGFPWAIYNKNGSILEKKEAVFIQETPYDVLSALLLKDYFGQFLS